MFPALFSVDSEAAAITTDALAAASSLVELWLRLATPWPLAFLKAGLWMALGVVVIGLPLYAFSGQYKGLTRYVGSSVASLGSSQWLVGLVACSCRRAVQPSYAASQ